MKTFDLAIKYLQESEIDFKNWFNLYSGTESPPEVMQKLHACGERYMADKTNAFSNDYYRQMCFEEAFRHLQMKAHGLTSFWDVAIEIVEAHKDVLKNKFETDGNSVYPKIMMDAFIKYCDELNPQPTFLGAKSEVRHEFFMGAFHYITDKES